MNEWLVLALALGVVAVQLLVLYFVIRAAVEHGIADALKRVNLGVLGNALRGGSDAPNRPANADD